MAIQELWGAGSFDNDVAMRWVEALEDAADLEPLEAVLDRVLESDEVGETPDEKEGSQAIAAAETLAALADRPANRLPEEVRQWCFDNPGLEISEATGKAVQALGVLLQDSPLRTRFEEHGLLEEWEVGVEGLRDRLQEV